MKYLVFLLTLVAIGNSNAQFSDFCNTDANNAVLFAERRDLGESKSKIIKSILEDSNSKKQGKSIEDRSIISLAADHHVKTVDWIFESNNARLKGERLWERRFELCMKEFDKRLGR